MCCLLSIRLVFTLQIHMIIFYLLRQILLCILEYYTSLSLVEPVKREVHFCMLLILLSHNHFFMKCIGVVNFIFYLLLFDVFMFCFVKCLLIFDNVTWLFIVYSCLFNVLQGRTQRKGFWGRNPSLLEAKVMLFMAITLSGSYQVVRITPVQINNSNQILNNNQHVTSLKQ